MAMWLVVGLGNPGSEYRGQRHNIGFDIVDDLAERLKAPRFRSKFSGELSRAEMANGDDVILLKPQTFMNLSGDSAQPCAAFFKVPVERIIIIHDELDVPFGEIRLKAGGGHGGHNGLRSLIHRLGTPNFVRMRIGIGRPPTTFRGPVADYVLSKFTGDEPEKLPALVELGAKTMLDISARGLTAAMKRRNTRPKKKKKKPTTADQASAPTGRQDEAGVSRSTAGHTDLKVGLVPPGTFQEETTNE